MPTFAKTELRTLRGDISQTKTYTQRACQKTNHAETIAAVPDRPGTALAIHRRGTASQSGCTVLPGDSKYKLAVGVAMPSYCAVRPARFALKCCQISGGGPCFTTLPAECCKASFSFGRAMR